MDYVSIWHWPCEMPSSDLNFFTTRNRRFEERTNASASDLLRRRFEMCRPSWFIGLLDTYPSKDTRLWTWYEYLLSTWSLRKTLVEITYPVRRMDTTNRLAKMSSEAQKCTLYFDSQQFTGASPLFLHIWKIAATTFWLIPPLSVKYLNMFINFLSEKFITDTYHRK